MNRNYKIFRFSLIFLGVLVFFASSCKKDSDKELDATSNEHPIDIHPNGRVASLLMSDTEFDSWISNDNYNNESERKALIKDVYKKFKDDFDYIFLVLNVDEKPAGFPYGQLIHVSNNVEGIGLDKFDYSSEYGSAGKLKAVMHLTRLDYLQNGPSLHELMHNWANFGIYTEFVTGTGASISSVAYKPHWGFTGGSTKGQLGGFKQSTLVDHGSNSYTVEQFGGFANGGNSKPYNELELYLMGMIPVSQVTDFDVFTDITSLTAENTHFNFIANTRTTYTPEKLIEELGAREPSSTDSQKDFKLLVLVLTNKPLTDDQWDKVDKQSELFGKKGDNGINSYNFWEATGGKGTMETNNIENSVLGASK